MRALPIVLAATLALGACAKKDDSDKGPDGWPKGISANFAPRDLTVNAGGKLRMWIENKSGKPYKVEWSHDGNCGKFMYDRSKGSEATLIGVVGPEDCTTKLSVKMTGKDEPLEKQVTAVVKGSVKLKELVLRPDPIPGTWLLVNNYDQTMSGQEVKCVTIEGGDKKNSHGFGGQAREKTDEQKAAEAKAKEEGKEIEVVEVFDDVTLNLRDAPFGPWTFEFANCSFGAAPEGETGVLPLAYDLPHNDDYCGFFENLGMGKDCETTPLDASVMESVTFIVRSGDGEKHSFFVELVAWEKYAEFHQGRSEAFGPIEAGKDWKRFEIPVSDIVKKEIDPASIKSVSFKVRREANYPDHGLILFDNVAFVRKGDAAKTE
jgi:hypothetical protein